MHESGLHIFYEHMDTFNRKKELGVWLLTTLQTDLRPVCMCVSVITESKTPKWHVLRHATRFTRDMFTVLKET